MNSQPHIRFLFAAPIATLFIVACGRSVPSTVPVALTPCPISGVGPVDSTWRQVRASGFSFCIPGTWQASGQAGRGSEGSITWGEGRPQPVDGARASVTGEVVTTGRLYPGVPNPAPLPGPSEPCSSPMNTPFTIDDVVVVVTQTACRGTWTTTGWSTTPAIYVQGKAQSAEAAKLLNAIMVTIRFASPNR